MKNTLSLFVATLILVQVPGLCFADVEYEAETSTLIVIDCPKEKPGTLADLLAADKKYGWAKVSYDEDTDTYTVSAHLRIGMPVAADTYFQMGSPGHLDETLALAGNLIAGKASDGYKNEISIGRKTDARLGPDPKDDPQNKVAQPRVEFKCSKKGEFGLRGGYRGAWFHFYNATVTSFDPELRFDTSEANLAFRDSLFSHAIGINHGAGIVADNTTFRFTGQGLRGIPQDENERSIVGCTFQGLDMAVGDTGSLRLTVCHSIFGSTNDKLLNKSNFHIQYGGRLTVLNCLLHGRGYLRDYVPKKGTYEIRHSRLLDKRRLLVKVTDQNGMPLEGAIVKVTKEQPEGQVFNHECNTAKDGLTLPPRDLNAITVMGYVRESAGGEQHEKAKVAYFTYTVEASKTGYESEVLTGVGIDKEKDPNGNEWYRKVSPKGDDLRPHLTIRMKRRRQGM